MEMTKKISTVKGDRFKEILKSKRKEIGAGAERFQTTQKKVNKDIPKEELKGHFSNMLGRENKRNEEGNRTE